jgi:hypothetical protein
VNEHVSGLEIEKVVREEQEALDKEWSVSAQRVWIAPGEELLGAVFESFGTTSAKPKDAKRIAQAMRREEIDEEIAAIIKEAVSLAGHRSDA